jgi:spermidine synthase
MKARSLFLMALALASPAVAQRTNVLHQERSLYRNILVTQDGDERCMVFRVRQGIGRESCMFVSRPAVHAFPYTQMMLAGLFLNPNPKRVLIIGLGGGTVPTTLQAMVPGAIIDNVELDQSVVTLARDYFGFKTGPRMRVFVEDGRVFVKRRAKSGEKYDIVMLDAFDGDYIPEHMLTQEFLREVRSTMTPNGVIVANTFPKGQLYAHESTTYRSIFGPFYNMRMGNRVIIGKIGTPVPMAQIRRNASAFNPTLVQAGTNARELLDMMSTTVDWNPKARVLTDQYSPSNLLNAATVD